jgi:hypothetical protein
MATKKVGVSRREFLKKKFGLRHRRRGVAAVFTQRAWRIARSRDYFSFERRRFDPSV